MLPFAIESGTDFGKKLRGFGCPLSEAMVKNEKTDDEPMNQHLKPRENWDPSGD